MEQKYVYIYEDRPVVKERVSHYVESTFVEREYFKQVRPIDLVPTTGCCLQPLMNGCMAASGKAEDGAPSPTAH